MCVLQKTWMLIEEEMKLLQNPSQGIVNPLQETWHAVVALNDIISVR